MHGIVLRGIEFKFPIPNSFLRCPLRGTRMNYTIKNMIILVFFALFIQELCYAPIGAVNGKGSGSDHRKDRRTNLESGESDNKLIRSLLHVWMESDPATEGHADRMFQTWSSNPSQYPPMSKNKLYQTARHLIERKLPHHDEAEEKQRKRQMWAEFKVDVGKFLAKLPDSRVELPRPMCDLFLEKHPRYTVIDHRAMSRYMYNERSSRRKTSEGPQGSHSQTSYDQPSHTSVYQNSGTSSSHTPQTYPHPQGYFNPHQLQPSYVDYAHVGMLYRTPRILPYHKIHHLRDRLHQGEAHYYHGESSSQKPCSSVERHDTSRHDYTSRGHGRSRRDRTGDRSEASTSQEHDDDLDLDLHL